MLITIAFWACVAFVIYAYAGYAVCLAVVARIHGTRPVRKDDVTPRVSFIIAAHNEAKRIVAKIENTLAQDYPKDRFEIIVTSDCSTDGTDDLVRGYASRGVRLVRATERLGKENAQRHAIEAASGDVLVFSDAATRLDPDGVRNIVKSFADPSVGCVSSVDRMLDSTGQPTGEGGYVRYEMKLRSLESTVGSLVGLSGSFFAARREVCRPWRTDVPSDFTTVLNAVSQGYRGVSDSDAIGYYPDLADASKEYARKVRTVVRGVSGLLKHADLLNPFKHGMFAWQLFSHKLCRWLVPFAMMAALVLNLVLAVSHVMYRPLAVLHVGGYVLALLALKWPTSPLRPLRPIGYLVLANASIVSAWVRLVRGQQYVLWTPSER
jgi:glycosyltransferase involved in cell wall biosynthesis